MSTTDIPGGWSLEGADSLEFEKLCDRVVAGQQLPRAVDLIRGAPFFRENIDADAVAFAERFLEGLGAPPEDGDTLLFALADLTAAPNTNDFLMAAHAFEELVGKPEGAAVSAGANAARCRFYAAISGHHRSWNEVAAYAVEIVHSDGLPDSSARAQAVAAIAWLLVSTGQRRPPEMWTRCAAHDLLTSVEAEPGPGRGMVERMLRTRRPEQTPSVWSDTDDENPFGELPEPATVSAWPPVPSGEIDRQAHTETLSRIVIKQIGNAYSPEGKRVAAEFKSLVGQALPLVPVPDLSEARRRLLDEFPYAIAAVDVVLGQLSGMAWVKLPPMLFVAPPGFGKTTFVIRVAEVLGLPTELFPCGASSDGAVVGTPRRWGTAEPSLPVSVVRATGHANPCIVLDELDKAAVGRINGSLQDALPAFLAPSTAGRFRDPYVEASVDLAAVVWLGTANSVQDLSRPVLDRLRIIPFPRPGVEHVGVLANSMMRRLVAERGWHSQWAMQLEGWELTALKAAWNGGSLRALELMVRAVLTTRERADAIH